MKLFLNFIEYRELLYNLAIKEIKVRYKSALLGFIWALLVPVSIMFVFLIIFSMLFKIKELTPVYLLAALFPWIFLSMSLSGAATCIVENSNIIKKVFFPRELLPVSIVLANFFNFVLSIALLIVISIISKNNINATLLFLPIVMIMQALFVSGITLIFSALFVYFRDIKYFVEILLTIWFYLTPIFYDQKLIRNFSEKAFTIFLLNPMTGLIVMYRDILINGILSSSVLISFTFFLCVLTFVIGLILNKKLSPYFADYV
ncbi:MAG TPA: ABC transporter permease [bacterium]|nr:ABC transporter permease [bacterium]